MLKRSHYRHSIDSISILFSLFFVHFDSIVSTPFSSSFFFFSHLIAIIIGVQIEFNNSNGRNEFDVVVLLCRSIKHQEVSPIVFAVKCRGHFHVHRNFQFVDFCGALNHKHKTYSFRYRIASIYPMTNSDKFLPFAGWTRSKTIDRSTMKGNE